MRGHRDVNSTSCPGDELYAWLKGGGWKAEPEPPNKPDGFWKWYNWYNGTGRYAKYGPRSKEHRPDVPAKIPESWWKRREAALASPGD